MFYCFNEYQGEFFFFKKKTFSFQLILLETYYHLHARVIILQEFWFTDSALFS